MFTQITLLCPLSSLVSVHQFFSPNTRFLLPWIYDRQDVVDTNVTWHHSRPFESAGNLGPKTTHRQDIGRRPKRSPVEDGHLKQEKPATSNKILPGIVEFVFQTWFNMGAHACAPKRASTWWVSAWKLQGCGRCALKTTDIPWFLFQMLKVVNEELHLTLWLPAKLRKLGHVEP